MSKKVILCFFIINLCKCVPNYSHFPRAMLNCFYQWFLIYTININISKNICWYHNYAPKKRSASLVTLSALMVPQVITMTDYSATSDDKLVKLTTYVYTHAIELEEYTGFTLSVYPSVDQIVPAL